ncbi:MAG: hypothetical protein F6K09_09750 [Merismopedia sp. SIO2A8]|nr:hypothetical protein [Symploca sp. SIO2B6]NET48991.1 hypothetical protein [Merismopedia sp. SIO2A8]
MSNLFGLQTKYIDEIPEDTKQPESGQNKEAFFLDPDQAKTLGDIEYMRTPTKIKKSFPKTRSNPKGSEVIEQTSATEKVIISKNQQSAPTPNPETKPVVEAPQQESGRRSASTDSSMDMFRKMARDIKK